MDKTGLTYNTEKKQIIISEYGRNIQEMIARVVEIEDRKERTAAANMIVNVMIQMNPQAKSSNDYLHKMWDHLYIMSEGKLDVDAPFAPPIIEEQATKPCRIEYRISDIRYGHYGQYMIEMIGIAAKEEDEKVREALAFSLADQMKRNFLAWNGNVVNDAVIIDDLKKISEGRLVLPEDVKLTPTSEILSKNPPQQNQKKNKKNKPQQVQNQQNQQQNQQQGQQPGKKKKVPNLKANANNPNNPAYKKKIQQP
ncbi:MAG: DUF4290 domain-containing protein [Bacteroidales bacterium]|nr:DUF4290 domain-containing protein [Bacteroidales bacterium]